MQSLRLVLLSFLTIYLVGTASAETLRVFAAASLTDSFKEIGAEFEKEHPGDKVEFNFAGSQVLRTQIEQGAPADVFASADTVQMAPVQKAKLVGPSRVFAHNLLVAIAPSNRKSVRRLQDLAKPGVKLVLAGPTAPVGRYTTQLITKLNASGLYGDDFNARVTSNVVSQETNVRAVLSKVAMGEADAGVVYATDAATQANKVRVIAVPRRLNIIATYPIAVVTKSGARSLAQAFVEEVAGSKGQAVLRRYGFLK